MTTAPVADRKRTNSRGRLDTFRGKLPLVDLIFEDIKIL